MRQSANPGKNSAARIDELVRGDLSDQEPESIAR